MVPRPPSTSRGPGIANSSVNVGGAYTAVVPFRLVDTRAGSGYYGQGQPLGPGATFTFPVSGQDLVPRTATAAALNVTVTDTTSPSYLTVFPAGGSQPFVSSVNWGPGETVPNLVIVPLGNTGEVSVFNQLGQADLVVDLEGYFVPEAAAAARAATVP
ncbi:MAG: hypothetical protein ACRENV_04190 [Candidatus Dormibacteria bacterium]